MHAHPYVYESIHYNSDNKTKIFTTSMEFSGFHWHHHYELVLILKGQIDATVNAIESMTPVYPEIIVEAAFLPVRACGTTRNPFAFILRS